MNVASVGIWTEALSIRSYDVDFRKRATAETVCRYFLEAAWNHAEFLGVGYSHLANQKRFWVLARLVIKFGGYFQWGDSAVLKTWPRPTKSVLAMREFEILASDGGQRVGGSSCWLVLDSQNRKPQRIDGLLSHLKDFPARLAIGQEPAKLDVCPGEDVSPAAAARYSDIDINGHANSGRYLSWMLDSYPLDFHRRNDLRMLEVNYIGEVLAGDSLSIRSRETTAGVWSHSLFRQNGTEVCRARMHWEPAPGAAANELA